VFLPSGVGLSSHDGYLESWDKDEDELSRLDASRIRVDNNDAVDLTVKRSVVERRTIARDLIVPNLA
jgi:hypothetical protein